MLVMQSPPSLKCHPELAASPIASVSHTDEEFTNSGGGDCRDAHSSLLGSERSSGQGVLWPMPLQSQGDKHHHHYKFFPHPLH